MKSILYIILVLCIGSVAYSISLLQFIKERQERAYKTDIIRDRTKDRCFIGKEIYITADDGQKFILQEFNVIPESHYIHIDYAYYDPYRQIDIINEYSVVYVLMCENKADIMFSFEHFKDYFDEMSEDDYSLTITNLRKYENISLYEFTFDYKLPQVQPIHRPPFYEHGIDRHTVKYNFWGDIKEHKYCGERYPAIEYIYTRDDFGNVSYSLEYTTAPEGLTEYYNYTKDMHLGNVKEYLNTLYNYEEKQIRIRNAPSYRGLERFARESLALISYFEPEVGKEFQAELKMMQNERADYNDFRRTEPSNYIGSVNEITAFYTKENTRGSKYNGKGFDDRVERVANSKIPNFDLPETEEELAEYVAWISEIYGREIYARDTTVTRFFDGSEMKIQYNLTTDPEGLRVIFVDSTIRPQFRAYQ